MSVVCDGDVARTLHPNHPSLIRLAKLGGRFDQCVEYGLEIELGAANNAEYLADGCLRFQRLGQLAFARLLSLKEARVLDGDHGLVGKGLHELNLLCREGPHLVVYAHDHADYDIVSEHWHGEEGAVPSRLSASPRILGVVQHVVDVDHPAL